MFKGNTDIIKYQLWTERIHTSHASSGMWKPDAHHNYTSNKYIFITTMESWTVYINATFR